jgi:hypothetical protein
MTWRPISSRPDLGKLRQRVALGTAAAADPPGCEVVKLSWEKGTIYDMGVPSVFVVAFDVVQCGSEVPRKSAATGEAGAAR